MSVNASDQKLVVNTVIEVTVSDKVLFGDRFEIFETVPESTELRDVLRQQLDRLMILGYRFDAMKQVWQRTSVNASTV